MYISLQQIGEYKNLITFLALEVVMFITYIIVVKAIFRSQLNLDNQKRMVANSKALFFFLTLIFGFSIWHTEIYSMILSLAAFAAATAIATKELLLCMAGSFYRTSARPFQIGDRIEINGLRGDVIEIGLLSTQLLEVGPGDLTHQYTGRTLTIPNNFLISEHITNETYSDEFVLHVFKIQIKARDDWEHHRDSLLACAQTECEQFIPTAKAHFERIARKRHLVTPIIEPQVNIKISAPDALTLVVRVAVPARERGKIEQKIVRGYLRKTISLSGDISGD